MDQLDLGYQQGNDRLLLRFPLVITHVIDHHSPLRAWQSGPSALAADADSEIVVVVSSAPCRHCHLVSHRIVSFLISTFAGVSLRGS